MPPRLTTVRMATQLVPAPESSGKRPRGRLYPIQLSFSYIALRRGQVIQRGWGETTEMSSTHIRVKRIQGLNPGVTQMVMSIAWPAKLPDGTGLQLVVQVRPDTGWLWMANFSIQKYEFRTASKNMQGFGMRLGLMKAREADDPKQPASQRPEVAAGAAV